MLNSVLHFKKLEVENDASFSDIDMKLQII